MKLDGITVWAIAATAVALVLAGMQIQARIDTQVQTQVNSGPEATEPGGEGLADTYSIPDWLIGAPMEWRSEFDGSHEGFALRLDYDKRKFLVDHCEHPGFFDRSNNRPIEPHGEPCNRVLTAALLKFTDRGVLVQSTDGTNTEVHMTPMNEHDTAKLEIRLDGHRLTLVPGQTNDLIVDITSTPEMKAEFEQLFEFKLQEQRQLRATMTATSEDGVPRFEVPASVIAANEEVRAQDAAASIERQ